MNNRVIKNASWIIVCKIIQSALSLVIGVMTARYLGPSNYGLINYAASIVAFVVPLMQLGFRNTLVQEFIKKPLEEGKALGTALLLNVLSAFLCAFGILVFVSIVNAGEIDTIVVCALYSVTLVFQALETIQYWFQSKLLSKYIAVISVIAYIIVSAYKFILLILNKGIYWFAISQALDYMIISVSLIVVYKKNCKQKLSFSAKKGKEMLSTSKHYIFSSMLVAVFGYVGNVFLKFLINEEAVGYYTAAITCAGITNFVFAAIIDSARPSILESKNNGSDLYKKKIIHLYSIIIALTLAQSVFITIFADLCVKILYGSKYIGAITPLRIYTWQTTFSQIGTIRNIWILAEQKQRYLWCINLCGALVSVVLNFALIPIVGVVGAAISAVATQFITNMLLGFIIKPIRENNRLIYCAFSPKRFVEITRDYFRFGKNK